MYFITAISSITCQDSFQQENLYRNLVPARQGQEIPLPNYKDFLPANQLRRLSPVLKNAITAATDCFQQSGKPFDAIVIGTSLGCLTDTEKFLIAISSSDSEVFSPTSFIQSTHNTIAGQISLMMANHSYNMTHTQNSLSFEAALLDAMLCIDEGKAHVLAGAADEYIPFMDELDTLFNRQDVPFTSGTSMFCLSGERHPVGIYIAQAALHCMENDIEGKIADFLSVGNDGKDLDLVLYSGICPQEITAASMMDYTVYSGFYFSNASFALHLAHDYLQDTESGGERKRVLIVNNLNPRNLGLILVEKYGA